MESKLQTMFHFDWVNEMDGADKNLDIPKNI